MKYTHIRIKSAVGHGELMIGYQMRGESGEGGAGSRDRNLREKLPHRKIILSAENNSKNAGEKRRCTGNSLTTLSRTLSMHAMVA